MAALEQSLNGRRILVTRPQDQSAHLSTLITAAGGEAVLFPVIAIKPVARQAWTTQGIAETEVVIFVSRNAVMQFAPAWHELLADTVCVASVGHGTAEALRQQGRHVDAQPQQSTGSEGLLSLPLFAQMAGKRVLIVRGRGGREYLAETLRQRGAQVRYLEVYERRLPVVSEQQIQQALSADCVLCTSVAGVKNLCILLHSYLKDLHHKPMVVCSQRIRQYALSAGFQHVEVSTQASDKSLVAQLLKMEHQ